MVSAILQPLHDDSLSFLWTKPTTAYSSGNRIGFDKRIFSDATNPCVVARRAVPWQISTGTGYFIPSLSTKIFQSAEK
jgi:hypothetical protein